MTKRTIPENADPVADRKDRLNLLDVRKKYFVQLINSASDFSCLARGVGVGQIYAATVDGLCVSYNRRRRRHGPLFQDRYKSIVCDASDDCAGNLAWVKYMG